MRVLEAARSTSAIFWREMTRYRRQRIRLAVTLFQPVIWLGLLGSTMNAATSRIPGVALVLGAKDYFDYMTPGVIVLTTLFGGIYAGMSVIWDRRLGFLAKMLASPIARSSIPLGKMLAAGAQNTIQAVIVLAAARLFGVVFVTGVLGMLAALFITFLVSAFLSGISIALAARIRSQEVLLAVVGFLTMPLIFTSTVMVPTTFMPGWLAELTAWNPLTYAAAPLRTLVSKGWFWKSISLDTASVALVAVAVTLVAIGAFRRPEV
ncbi:MAG: ABC transporter permease [Spirochaetes bacterium]|nr:ABC transporter permease [Spirochaetota bacterium]